MTPDQGPILLRTGDASDLPSVNIVMQAAFDPRYGEAWTRSQCAAMLSLPGIWLTLAEIKDRIVGFALTRAILDEAELLLIAVHPDARGRGVGGAMVRSILHECATRNVGMLHLEVRANNPALKLYIREGFKKAGEKRNYYRGHDGELHDAHTYHCQLV